MTRERDRSFDLQQLQIAAARGNLRIEDWVEPRSRHVVAAGIRLHYFDWPAQRGASEVLFLHGGALTAHTWNLVCMALRPRYRCIAVDLRGHGDSEWSAEMDYSLAAYLGDLEAFIKVVRLKRPALVGMSLGGLNALDYASRHSDTISGLVVVDVGPEPRHVGTQRIRAFLNAESEHHSIEHFVDLALSFNPRRDRDQLRSSLRTNLRRLPDGRWTWKYDRRSIGRRDPEEQRRELVLLAERIPQIRCPVLVVRGEQSDVFLDRDAEKLASSVPDARWVRVADAGHTVQGDNPRGMVEALLSFFEEIGL